MDLQDVQPLVGQQFAVPSQADGIPYVELTLVSAEASGQGHAGRAEPFSLIFEGPSTFPLNQGSYALSNPTMGEEPIFIVPLSDDGTVRQYQAVFN